MKSHTKRRYRAVVVGLIYVLLWIWFCRLSNVGISYSLIAGTLIALPTLLWVVDARRDKNERWPRPSLPWNKTKNPLRSDRLRREDVPPTAQMSDQQAASLADLILRRNRDLIDKFLEIAERKVSVLDAYGDEKWSTLPGEILLCMKKLAQREDRAIDWSAYSKPKRKMEVDSGFVPKHASPTPLESGLPKEYRFIESKLKILFRDYHERRKARSLEEIDIDALSGVEFQTHVAAVLCASGYTVTGTPITGDQGGDLIVKEHGKTYIIQAKRSARPVGNRAVQEAISAVSFYGANQGWVITNATFTPSAVMLAQKANIKLIDGLALRIKSFLNPESFGEYV